jgi:serine/threonine-protein kinase HipA
VSASLEHVRFVEAADVYKAGAPAASLRRSGRGVVFAYDEDYRAGGGPPVASTLPLSAEAMVTPAGAVPAFFAGLLPEGRRLAALRRAVKTSADDELSLLIAVGADAIGDVQVVPHGQPPARPPPRLDVRDWSDVRFADVLHEDPARVDLAALPGVQAKVSAATIAVPAAGLFILKLDPPEYPHVVANEHFFLEAARLSGLPAAEAELVTDADGRPGLLVRRFDRAVADGQVVTFAQEDACQVLGRYPADKYTVTAEQALAGLVALTRAKPVAARDLLAQVAFAYLTGNGDQHAKNLSVVRDAAGEWRATPAYDLPSTYPYGDVTMALSIGGRVREDITRASFLELGVGLGVPERATRKVLDRLCDAVDGWLPGLDGLPFDDRRRYKLGRLVHDRRAKLAAG